MQVCGQGNDVVWPWPNMAAKSKMGWKHKFPFSLNCVSLLPGYRLYDGADSEVVGIGWDGSPGIVGSLVMTRNSPV